LLHSFSTNTRIVFICDITASLCIHFAFEELVPDEFGDTFRCYIFLRGDVHRGAGTMVETVPCGTVVSENVRKNRRPGRGDDACGCEKT